MEHSATPRGLDQTAHIPMSSNVRMPEIRVGDRELGLYLIALAIVPLRLQELIQPALGICYLPLPPVTVGRVRLMPGESRGGLFDEFHSTQIFHVQTLHELLLVLHCSHAQFTHGSRGVVLPRVGLDEVGLVQREQGIAHENHLGRRITGHLLGEKSLNITLNIFHNFRQVSTRPFDARLAVISISSPVLGQPHRHEAAQNYVSESGIIPPPIAMSTRSVLLSTESACGTRVSLHR